MSITKIIPLQPGQRYDFRIKLKRKFKNSQIETIERLKIEVVQKTSYRLNAFHSLLNLNAILLSGQGSSHLHLIEELAEQIVNGYRKQAYLGSWLFGEIICSDLRLLEKRLRIAKKLIKIRRNDPSIGEVPLPLPKALKGHLLSFFESKDLLNTLRCTKKSSRILEALKPAMSYELQNANKTYLKLEEKQDQLNVSVGYVSNDSFEELKNELIKILHLVQNDKYLNHWDVVEGVAKGIFHSFRCKAICWMTKDNSDKLAQIETLYNQITNTIDLRRDNNLLPPPVFPFPDEITLNILKNLHTLDLGAVLKVNRAGRDLGYETSNKLAIALNFPGKPTGLQGYQHLFAVSKLLPWLIAKGYFCLDFGVKNGEGEILVEETLKKLKELQLAPSKYLSQPVNSPTVLHALINELSEAKDESKRKLLDKQMKILVEWGVTLNGTNDSGNTPLHSILSIPDTSDELVLAMIRAGADIKSANHEGDTPLHLAATYRKSVEILKEILDQNPDVNISNSKGNSPLHLAIFHKMIYPLVSGIQLLLEKGADADYLNPTNLNTVFHCLAHNYYAEMDSFGRYKLKDWGDKVEVENLLKENTNPMTSGVINRDNIAGWLALYHAQEKYYGGINQWTPSRGRSWSEWK